MDIQWFSKSLRGVATIYDNNITLNTVAANHFKNSYGVIVGFLADSKSLLLKPVTKEDIDLGLYKDVEIHNISIKPSYGRVNGKSIIDQLCELYPISFDHLNKFVCEWDDVEHSLKIQLERRVN